MDAEWFYLEAGQQRGPVPLDELRALLQARLPRGTLVWRDGLADWQPAKDVPELVARPSPPPPRPAPPSLPPPLRTPMRSPAPGSASGAPAPLPRDPDDAGRTHAQGAPADPETLNPFALWRRSFSFGGRFDRVQFALAFLGILVAGFLALLALGAWGAATGREPSETGKLLIGLISLGAGPVVVLILLGSVVRRLHDLGLSGWLAVALLVPCLWPFVLVALLVAPSAGPTLRPGSTPGPPHRPGPDGRA